MDFNISLEGNGLMYLVLSAAGVSVWLHFAAKTELQSGQSGQKESHPDLILLLLPGWDFLLPSRCQQWLLCGPVQKANLQKAGMLYKGGDRKAPLTGREVKVGLLFSVGTGCNSSIGVRGTCSAFTAPNCCFPELNLCCSFDQLKQLSKVLNKGL